MGWWWAFECGVVNASGHRVHPARPSAGTRVLLGDASADGSGSTNQRGGMGWALEVPTAAQGSAMGVRDAGGPWTGGGDGAARAGDMGSHGQLRGCSGDASGPQLVAVVQKVISGLIGRTLSSFGIVGLYSVFVYGVGRFLRLSLSSLHQRIPFRYLPNCRRLVALVQVSLSQL